MTTTSPEPLRDELIELMREHDLSPEEVASLTEYSKSTVEAWLMPDRESKRARPVRKSGLSLLKAKIEAAKANLNI